MPLKGDKSDDPLFCVLIPQPNDRSLTRIKTYRPWELKGDGKSFANKFFICSLKNMSRDVTGTLRITLDCLKPLLPAPVGQNSDSRTPARLVIPNEKAKTPSSAPVTAGDLDGVKTRRMRRLEGSAPFAPFSAPPPVTKGAASHTSPAPQRSADAGTKNSKKSLVLRSTKRTSDHLETPMSQPPRKRGRPPNKSTAASPLARFSSQTALSAAGEHCNMTPRATPPPTLAPAQAERVHFILRLPLSDDTIMESVCSLGEAPSLEQLFSLFAGDVQHKPEAAAAFSQINRWQMAYQLPGDRTKRCVAIRKGSEPAFERVKDAIARASLWPSEHDSQRHDGDRIKVEILLTPMTG